MTTYHLDIGRPTNVYNCPIIDAAWAPLLTPLGFKPGIAVLVVPDRET